MFPVSDSKGQIIGINGVMFDITNKKNIEEILEEGCKRAQGIARQTMNEVKEVLHLG